MSRVRWQQSLLPIVWRISAFIPVSYSERNSVTGESSLTSKIHYFDASSDNPTPLSTIVLISAAFRINLILNVRSLMFFKLRERKTTKSKINTTVKITAEIENIFAISNLILIFSM